MSRVLRVVRRTLRGAQRTLSHWMEYLSRDPDRPIQQFTLRIIIQVYRLLLLVLDGWNGHAEIWVGKEIDSGLPLRVAYIGDERGYKVKDTQYLYHILFQEAAASCVERGRFPMFRARKIARQLSEEVDLVILASNRILRWHPPHNASGAWWIVSPWLRTVMDLSPGRSWEDIERCMHGQKSNIKIMKHSGNGLRFSHSDEDFDFFYEHMHIPLIKERHPEYGYLDSKAGLRELFNKGFLAIATAPDNPDYQGLRGEIIAGALYYQQGKTMFGMSIGVRDGNKRWYAQGAMTMMYYHPIRWCYENNIRRMDFGGVRPFQNDGLFQYKQRWGFEATYDPWFVREWLFWVPQKSSTMMSWVDAHPFLLPMQSGGNEKMP
jgi:hypothetical protein